MSSHRPGPSLDASMHPSPSKNTFDVSARPSRRALGLLRRRPPQPQSPPLPFPPSLTLLPPRLVPLVGQDGYEGFSDVGLNEKSASRTHLNQPQPGASLPTAR